MNLISSIKKHLGCILKLEVMHSTARVIHSKRLFPKSVFIEPIWYLELKSVKLCKWDIQLT